MPIFSFQCSKCGEEFEALLRSGESASCPACASTEVDRQVSSPAIGGRVKAAIGRARQQAAKEGHFSNYSSSELKGKL